MAKGKAKSSSDSLAPPQARSLRSRKREYPSDEISKTDHVQTTLHHQYTEQNNPAVDATPLQCHQESTMVSTQQHQAAEQSCLTKQDPATEGKHAEASNVIAKAFEEQEENTVTNPNKDSQLEGVRVHTDNDANKNKEEITAEESNRAPSETYTDQIHFFLPTSGDGDRSCATGLEEQLCAREEENSQCNLDRNQETDQEESSSNVYMADVKEIKKEAAAGLPAKKKRRMGMCGLTEKERSHFLQAPKRENGQNRPERVEKQICNNTADLVDQEDIIASPPSLPIPVGSATEQAEIKLQCSHCGRDDRAETEVHIAVATSDGTSTVCDPGCSKGKSGEAEGGRVPGPEQTDDTDPPAEEGEGELLGNQEQQEPEGHIVEIMAEKPQEQTKDGDDGSVVVDQSPAITPFCSNPIQNKKTESQDAIESALLQVINVTRARHEKKEELTGDVGDCDGAEAGASSTWSGGFNCGSVELCGAAVTPTGSQRKDSRGPDYEPGAGPGDTSDPFGSGYLDYVSDSQLNTIVLTEEEVVEKEEDFGSPDCHEDATDLICGLIRELSSLNQKVMATHRDLENLRHSSKSARSSLR